MDFQNLSDKALLETVDLLVKDERERPVTILRALREVDRRRLYTTPGFCSLFEYARTHLKYSTDQSQRRIQCMMLVREIPSAEEKINTGSLNLTTLGLVDYHVKREEKFRGRVLPKEEKIQILDLVAGKTTRQAERILAELSSTGELYRFDTATSHQRKPRGTKGHREIRDPR